MFVKGLVFLYLHVLVTGVGFQPLQIKKQGHYFMH